MEKHRYGLMFPGRSRSCPVFSLAVAGFSLLCGSLGYGRLVRGGPAFMSVFRKHCAATARGYAAVGGEGGAYSGKDRDRAWKNGAYPCAWLYGRHFLYGNEAERYSTAVARHLVWDAAWSVAGSEMSGGLR